LSDFGNRDVISVDGDSSKLKIHSFQVRSDLEAYLEWEKKVDWIFNCHVCSDKKEVKVMAIEFVDYTVIWWDHIVTSR
jgi:hypothetical protein